MRSLWRLCPILALLLGAAPAWAAEPSMVAAGPVGTAFLWAATPCGAHLIPDTPARAFRRADNSIVVVASADTNWILTGTAMTALRPQCATVLASAEFQTGLLWIEAVFSRDGRHVDGIATRAVPDTGHQGCHAAQLAACWLNDLVAVVSEDGGRSFVLGGIIASAHGRYDPDRHERLGFFTTTNIAFRDGFYYALFSYAVGPKPYGNCLVRTADVGDPASWRAWDGQGFGQPLRDVAANVAPCAPVAPAILSHEARSISFVPAWGRWVAVFADRVKLPGDAAGVAGFYMSVSADLIHWGPAARVLAEHMQREPGACNDFATYPSLIDPHSRSRNFDTIDSPTAAVFFTYEHLKNCVGTYNRDLDYLPVRLAP